MDLEGQALVGAVSKTPDSQEVVVVDLKSPTRIRKRETPQLKRYIRAISIFPDVQAYVIAGLEGRVSVNHFIPDKQKDFVFKCHRKGASETEVYPIHALSVNSCHLGTFATCGGDGTLSYWDRNSKTRLKNFLQGGLPVTACAFNRTGRMMVYSTGYDWQRGLKAYNRDSMPTTLRIRGCPDSEIKPQSGGRR
ncbi:MAG: WD40 repeat domain-containing protein [archaeon]|nr:WD40 repeat domain-containing protein [archaeon]